MPLQFSWVIRSDLGTLTGAEMHDRPIALTGDALLAGYYVNELVLYLLHRHDPQPEIFAAYGHAIQGLANRADLAACLREFEMSLLRILGYAPILDHDAQTLEALQDEEFYEYLVEQGPVQVTRRDGPATYSGALLRAIGRQDFSDPEVLQGASRLLRDIIAYHLGGKQLKSRKVLLELRRSMRIRDNATDRSETGNPL